MATVTIKSTGETPAAKLIAAGNKRVEIIDAQGRTIVLKKPAPLARLDFAKAAGGAELNQLYLAEVMHLPFVVEIDGAAVATPGSDGELRALYARLGDDGNDAAQLGVLEHFMPKAAGEAEAELKNG